MARPVSASTATAFALVSATLMIAQQVAGKATRDALFLSNFDVTELPKAVIAAAVLSILAVLTMSRLLARYGPATLVPVAFGFSAAFFVIEWRLFAVDTQVTALLVYAHMAVFGAILISGFWSVVNERFDPHTARRAVAGIAAAAALGGVLGGVTAERITSLIELRAMLLMLALMHLLCMATVLGVGRPRHVPQEDEEPDVRSGLEVIARTPYLQQMALLMILAALLGSLLDYALKSQAAQRFQAGEELIGFFAAFYALVGVITFGLQTALGRRVLQRFGVAGTVAVLPGFVLLGGLISTALVHLWTVTVLRGAEAVLANSFFRSAFELFYSPLAPERKRPTKTLVDVGANRLGDMLGGGLLLALLAVLNQVPTSLVITLAMIAAAGALWVARGLHRGYVEQLAERLRHGAGSLDPERALNAALVPHLSKLDVSGERELVLAKIALRDINGDGVAEPHPHHPEPRLQHLIAAIENLSSGNAERVRATLNGAFMHPALVQHLLPLLTHPEVGREVALELRWLVSRCAGQITDALLDPDTPVAVRRRLPSVLEVYHSPRAADALIRGLADADAGVRGECAQALARMSAHDAELKIDHDSIYKAVEGELKRPQEPIDGGPDGRVERCFALLGLVLDRKALEAAFQALDNGHATIRGTALEYLTMVLPENIRRTLWPQIAADAPQTRSGRGRQDLEQELRATPSANPSPGRRPHS